METISAGSLQAGMKLIIGGSELCKIKGINHGQFTENEFDYQFGPDSKATDGVFKVEISAVDGNGEDIEIIFASNSRVAISL
jgi:hypothetical protein